MSFRAISMKLTFVVVIVLLVSEINSAAWKAPECSTTCGNLTTPFPFGTSSDCSLDDSFLITCNQSYNPPKPFLNSDGIEVLDRSLDGRIRVASHVVSDYYHVSGFPINIFMAALVEERLEGIAMEMGSGCPPKSHHWKIELKGTTLFYIASGLLIPVVGSFWIFRRHKENKMTRLRRNTFKRNGGLILQDMISKKQVLRIFSADELKMATDNYHEIRVIYREEHASYVYKGVLDHGGSIRMVTICQHGAPNDKNIEKFIKKIFARAQISHKNVVKLIGCCLETQAPMLVYEFVTNETLSMLFHDPCISTYLTWKIRLKIAIDIASALAYLHSEELIIHGDVKTANILLDEGYTAKISNFGPPGLIPSSLGTLGYLDPEYFHLDRLTEKSDVYSFGVVLAELLTGQKVLSSERETPSLAKYFVNSIKENRLIEIIDTNLIVDTRIEPLKEVAMVAVRCLEVKSEDRPSMKEVASELKAKEVQQASMTQGCGR